MQNALSYNLFLTGGIRKVILQQRIHCQLLRSNCTQRTQECWHWRIRN